MKLSDGIDSKVVSNDYPPIQEGDLIKVTHSKRGYNGLYRVTAGILIKWRWYNRFFAFLYYRVYRPVRKLFLGDER